MIRIAAVSIALVALGPGHLAAQVPSPEPRGGAAAQGFLGTWVGPYQSESAPPGSIRLVIAKPDTAWKVTLEVVADQPIAAEEVREFKVEGNTLSWVQDVMGMECRTIAKYEGGGLKGETECSQNGVVAITATFLLIKQ